jgi:protein-disulfide isomerase
MTFRAVALTLLLGWAASGTDFIKGNAFGNPAAPMMIEVFSDFQCPACKTLHDTEVPELMRDYVIPGKAYLIYRYFPLDMHPFGRKAAEVVCAAAQLGKYEAAANAAFAKQPNWSMDGKIEETVDTVLTSAEQQKLKTLLKSPAVQSAIQHDVDEGHALPVAGTPTLLVTYRLKRYPLGGVGVLKYPLVKAYLDDLLSK